MAYVVRSNRVGSPGFVRELQQAVWSVNPNLPLASVRTLDEIQADSMAQTSFALVMLAIAATVALLLGSVGIYGVIAYVATQRTREIGIRMALGAQTGDVRRLFLRHGLLLTGVRHGTGDRCGAGADARHVRFAVRRQPDGSRDVRFGRGEPWRLSPCWRRIFLPAEPRASTPSSPCAPTYEPRSNLGRSTRGAVLQFHFWKYRAELRSAKMVSDSASRMSQSRKSCLETQHCSTSPAAPPPVLLRAPRREEDRF